MIYLLASIFFSTTITAVFKLFERHKVHLLTGIIINYLVCYLCGVLIMGVELPWAYAYQPWFFYALGLGFFFITGFNMVGKTVALHGISLATLMQKMSLVLSVTFAIVYFSEPLSLMKVFGLAIGLLSILLYNSKVWAERSSYQGLLYVPILAWVISGIIEVGLLFTQKKSLLIGDDAAFVSLIFLAAGLMGLCWAILLGQHRELTKIKSLGWGILLGVPNFFSMYYLVKLLGTDWHSSIALPINNIGILICAALVGIAFFHEKLTRLQWIGLLLSVASIFILSQV